MSAPAAGIPGRRAARFYDSTVGKKFVMAISGIVLFGYVIAHLLGNLQIFMGPAQINRYAALLHSSPPLLWIARIVLLIMVGLHIWSSLQLALRKWDARPIGYVKKRAVGSSYASRTMYWSGPIIAAFVIYHLMEFTFGTGGTPYRELQRLLQRRPRLPQLLRLRLLHHRDDHALTAPVSRIVEHVPNAGLESSALHAACCGMRPPCWRR